MRVSLIFVAAAALLAACDGGGSGSGGSSGSQASTGGTGGSGAGAMGGMTTTSSGTGGMATTSSGTGGMATTSSGTGGMATTSSGTGGMATTSSGTGGMATTSSGTGGMATTSSGTGGMATTSSGTGGMATTSSGTGGMATTSSGTGGMATTSSGTGGMATTSSGTGGMATTSSSTGGMTTSSSGGGNAMSDGFDSAPLDPSWMIMNGPNFSYSLSASALHIVPTTNTLWWMSTNTGPFVYKMVSGDFKVTTAVRARSNSDPSKPVGPIDYQFGGLMARDPAGGTENYVFVVVGDRGATIEIETKSTDNNASEIDNVFWPSGDAQLRICRVGSTFHVYTRPFAGGTWGIATPYDPPFQRPDMPADLQVGVIAYTWTNTPDLRASFDHVLFDAVSSQADCLVD
ncbi:MAG: hypothetical protein IPK82_31350 [Polyangiaceae bacterium]|nr:hypothetical protein [Polyangiaceae bacterium]